jgi:hypothetical protein
MESHSYCPVVMDLFHVVQHLQDSLVLREQPCFLPSSRVSDILLQRYVVFGQRSSACMLCHTQCIPLPVDRQSTVTLLTAGNDTCINTSGQISQSVCCHSSWAGHQKWTPWIVCNPVFHIFSKECSFPQQQHHTASDQPYPDVHLLYFKMTIVE